ncbi:hypothetical protein GH714_025768 [Hevea brasiliensis]|uniref:Uncharacterized protein n=1 Tax=Hevea brasiliensis TaxID=3981 RepID=A0A6A6M8U9_HEVBR|nr:hypothetical protein GH714_025768 [Hevea brasiliensis]
MIFWIRGWSCSFVCLESFGRSRQNGDQKRGVQINQNALKAPTYTIVSNAGLHAAVTSGKLLEQDDHNLVYEAAEGE